MITPFTRSAALCASLLGALCLLPQAARTAPPPTPKTVVPGRQIEAGIQVFEVPLPHGDHNDAVWIYLPDRPKQPKVPVVLIAPAGARPYHGAALGEDSRPEHLPYVRAGYAVVAYEIDGNLGEKFSGSEAFAAARRFKAVDAGVKNARAALDYALSRVPRLDSSRVYSAGHSSAGTAALVLAENEPRVKGCIAYAPVCNVPARLGEKNMSIFPRVIPGFDTFARTYSPDAGLARLKCPLFLFHAEDDSIVPTRDVAQFAALAQKTNKRVQFVRVPSGDHYDSMIRQGIPMGIRWLNAVSAQ